MTYRFEHDPGSGAVHVRLAEGEYSETIPFAEPDLGAGVDVDAAGRVLGVGFASFSVFADIVACADGKLNLPDVVSRPAEDDECLLEDLIDLRIHAEAMAAIDAGGERTLRRGVKGHGQAR